MGSEVQILSPRPIQSRSMAVLLVTNDDGAHAAGLAALADALGDLGEVVVVAPDREQSAVGHPLTLHRPLRAERLAERRFAVNGTPSDCVNLGVLGLLPQVPALVVAGINHGSNLGDDVTYSGTVSAAMEGTLLGVPSIAVSLERADAGFAEAGRADGAVPSPVACATPVARRATGSASASRCSTISSCAAASSTRGFSAPCGRSRATSSSTRRCASARTATIRCRSARDRRSPSRSSWA